MGFPSTPSLFTTHTHHHWTVPPHSCWWQEKKQMTRKRERTGEEWLSVNVPEPNEARNAMNRLLGWFTAPPPGSEWAGDVWCGSASHWQDITKLHTLPFLSAPLVCITRLWITRVCFALVTRFFYFFTLPSLFSSRPTHTHQFVCLSTAGAHIQANEKWQLCTLFAIQHLPRPPVGQKEGELHSLAPLSPHSYCLSRISLILFLWFQTHPRSIPNAFSE